MLEVGGLERSEVPAPSPAVVALPRPGFSSAVVLAVAGGVTATASLATTVVVAHTLPAVAYGALTKLLGIFFVLSLPATALMVGIVRRVAAWEATGRGGLVAGWTIRVERLALAPVAGIVGVAWLVRTPLDDAVHVSGTLPLVTMVGAGGAFVLLTVDRGFLQARRRYGALAANVIVEGAVRTGAMIGLTAAGRGIVGACLGVLVGEAAGLGHARWCVRRPGRAADGGAPVVGAAAPVRATASDDRRLGRQLLLDVTAAAVAMVMIAVLQNGDVLVFGSRVPARSGPYGAISVPAKALIFWALLFSNYVIPEAAIGHHRRSTALRQLGHSLVLVLAPGLVLCAVALVAPRWLIDTVFGARYAQAAPGLAPLALAMALLSVSVVSAIYLLGCGWRRVTVPLVAGAACLLGVCAVAAPGLRATPQADLAVQAALAAVMVAAVALHHRARAGSVGIRRAFGPSPGGSRRGSV